MYVNCLINKVETRVLIDSGAQISVMPLSLAKKIGIDNLIDYDIRTEILGIGNENITDTIGRISLIDIYFPISNNKIGLKTDNIDKDWSNLIQISGSFTVIDNGGDGDIIFGIDLLTNNNVIIDFGNRYMIIDGLTIDFNIN
jgi:hypothetical protein